ncbi:MAG: XkdF-like putative serine protease domain-containing protein, partial [Candidatus Fonsibacter sp.]
MEVIELIIDENQELSGVDAISIVERPAIEENFIALSEQKEFKFESIDDEKRILIGALLIPDKKIIRRDGNREYYVYFSKKTIRQAMELYAKRGYQNNATFEHREDVTGLTLVESWIKEDNNNDKSNIYGLDLPVGSWVGTVKVNNDVIWRDYVKTGIVKGFSIEGYFADLKQNTEEAELS